MEMLAITSGNLINVLKVHEKSSAKNDDKEEANDEEENLEEVKQEE